MLQNHDNGVLSNGSDKALLGPSPIGSYYLVADKAGLRVITGGSVTNDLSAPTILRTARTFLFFVPVDYLRHFTWHVNRSRSPDDKLADKLDANSISRMFRREVTRGLQNENRSVFLVGLSQRVSDVNHPCNPCELIGAMNSAVQLVGSY